MNSGQLTAICLALLFVSLLLPWTIAVRYNNDRTPKTPIHRKVSRKMPTITVASENTQLSFFVMLLPLVPMLLL